MKKIFICSFNEIELGNRIIEEIESFDSISQVIKEYPSKWDNFLKKIDSEIEFSSKEFLDDMTNGEFIYINKCWGYADSEQKFRINYCLDWSEVDKNTIKEKYNEWRRDIEDWNKSNQYTKYDCGDNSAFESFCQYCNFNLTFEEMLDLESDYNFDNDII